MEETLWSCNWMCACRYTLCLITVDFQASEQTKLRLHDVTKWSDVTLGLWYMGLMRSASLGGACVSVWGWPPDGWTVKRFMDEWWRACGTADRKRGRFSYGQLMSDSFPCSWMELLASMVRNFAGWLIQCSHTLKWGRWTDLSSLCISAQSIHEQWKRGSLGEIKRFKMFTKEIFQAVYCYILFQSCDTQTELSEVLVTEN